MESASSKSGNASAGLVVRYIDDAAIVTAFDLTAVVLPDVNRNCLNYPVSMVHLHSNYP
jgi:hypothetical protein